MRGFTLLEVIIAVSILGSGIIAATSLMSRTIGLGSVVRDQLIAANLAQEGMEVIHNIRHTNWIKNTAWDVGFLEGDSCVNFDSTALINPCLGDSRRLFLFNNRYVHNVSGTSTIFLRNVNITSGLDGAAPFKIIRSVVSWGNSSLSVEERLYNWK